MNFDAPFVISGTGTAGKRFSRADINSLVNRMYVILDTREKLDTTAASIRIQEFPRVARQKLDFGDYSAFVEFINEAGEREVISLENRVVVERKKDLSELITCMTSQRARFERELERAKVAGAKTYLLLENTSLEYMLSGRFNENRKYGVGMTPKAFLATLTAWSARYDLRLFPLTSDHFTGQVILDILKKEMKEHLGNI